MQVRSKSILHGLPEDVYFCKSCVMSNQRPNSVVEFKNTGKKKNLLYFLTVMEFVVPASTRL